VSACGPTISISLSTHNQVGVKGGVIVSDVTMAFRVQKIGLEKCGISIIFFYLSSRQQPMEIYTGVF